ncbi:unnamed protein product [Didymodactylos carnosus]|uniref:Uncharacterized protein n=1 Tax=Didymodactylos carnosus TaxID=1234261 RepID=A0A813XE74_9BILA|nr:unnamed protein product [Didymodactylos carnosus]CAF3656784.1 unnamed protein product [Didymodactylos carnosus]
MIKVLVPPLSCMIQLSLLRLRMKISDYNDRTVHNASELATAIVVNASKVKNTLTKLDLYGNQISDRGGEALTEAVKRWASPSPDWETFASGLGLDWDWKPSVQVKVESSRSKIDDKINQAIVQDLVIDLGLPLSMGERDSVIRFIKKVDPKYSVVSRRSISRQYMPELYDKMILNLKSICNEARWVSLTLDTWTDRRKRSYFAATGHTIISENFKSFVLAFKELNGIHNGPLLLSELNAVISTFSLDSKLVRLVTDSASNNLTPFRGFVVPGFESYFVPDDVDDDTANDFENDSGSDVEASSDDDSDETDEIYFESPDVFRIPCFSHTLQLFGKDGLKKTGVSAKNALEKCSAITKLSHQSTHFAERLERINVSIPSPNKTRWNSQYDTLCKIVSMPTESLNQILKDLYKPDLCLSGKDISILNEFADVLAFFSEATKQSLSDKKKWKWKTMYAVADIGLKA